MFCMHISTTASYLLAQKIPRKKGVRRGGHSVSNYTTFACGRLKSFIIPGMSKISLEIQVGELLRAQKCTLTTAESCTGGLIGHMLTNVPGSSEYYIGGVVAYAYEAKVALLGVTWDALQKYGAVSEEVALAMARGARMTLNGHLGVAVTGIAGPGGGMPNKPVGLTWIALSTPEEEFAHRYVWDKDREGNKQASATAALQMVIDYLKKKSNYSDLVGEHDPG